jgi:small subunit ribosomal protein S21
MLIVDLNKEKNIETALRTLKSKVQKTRLIQELRNRKEYVKPSVENRKIKLKAIHTQKIKNGLN